MQRPYSLRATPSGASVSVNRGDLAKVVVSDSHMTDWVDDHALLAATMREVGNLALRYFRTDVNAWEKKGGTPVSDADLAVDRHLKQRLGAARPEYGWLSEETEDDTTRLTRRRVAVLYNPATEEFYEAIAERGARLNGVLIHVGDRHVIEGCRMAAFGPMFQHPAWREPWPEMQIIQRDSVAYRLALVASGEADAAFGLNTKHDWDLAAADLIVHEAGGLVSSHDGEPLVYNGVDTLQRSFLAAGPAMHATLLALATSSYGAGTRH
jgi:myo-inositol-1(or 4)-monophosphatase